MLTNAITRLSRRLNDLEVPVVGRRPAARSWVQPTSRRTLPGCRTAEAVPGSSICMTPVGTSAPMLPAHTTRVTETFTMARNLSDPQTMKFIDTIDLRPPPTTITTPTVVVQHREIIPMTTEAGFTLIHTSALVNVADHPVRHDQPHLQPFSGRRYAQEHGHGSNVSNGPEHSRSSRARRTPYERPRRNANPVERPSESSDYTRDRFEFEEFNRGRGHVEDARTRRRERGNRGRRTLRRKY
ncbi:hypothetical protein B0H16DRAFT_505070 [Mycena metata]|uniref:Uncharacterized protein n=1 Tax=Mycena metata TaxID=1033252 RepID=A0AAD7JI59_9AGAR|nr:hypothetical protein B0H16DRAFT_505070 [Mycena metata]